MYRVFWSKHGHKLVSTRLWVLMATATELSLRDTFLYQKKLYQEEHCDSESVTLCFKRHQFLVQHQGVCGRVERLQARVRLMSVSERGLSESGTKHDPTQQLEKDHK